MMKHSEELIALISNSEWFMQALRTVRELNMASWCIGAGAVRSVVWDKLHGYQMPAVLPDVDVAYFDKECSMVGRDAEYADQLQGIFPGIPWEVTNQANVHFWYKDCFGYDIPAFSSLEEAVGSWPEYATAVGLTLDKNDSIGIIAPHGLEDFFSVTIRHNPAVASARIYRQRTKQKNYAERWPLVKILE